jgi:hypothetical protein
VPALPGLQRLPRQAVSPVDDVYCPGGHRVQVAATLVDLAFGPKEPGWQIDPEQSVAPARANMPLGQAVQVAEAADVRPLGPKKPSIQGVPIHEV